MGGRDADLRLRRRESKLRINPDEAEQVREIFRRYLEHKALMPVVKELNAGVGSGNNGRLAKARSAAADHSEGHRARRADERRLRRQGPL